MSRAEPVGCLGMLLRLIGIDIAGWQAQPRLPYRVRTDFLTAAELNFFHALRSAVGETWVITAKVNLRDIFRIESDAAAEQSHRNRIDRKHVDFLLCDPATMQPRIGVELDDSSHRRPDRAERDVFVNDVFRSADLPLVRVPAARSYAVADLRQQLHDAAKTSARGAAVAVSTLVASDEPPVCPRCQSVMQRRTARKGPNAGQPFWGCSQYPKCDGVRSV